MQRKTEQVFYSTPHSIFVVLPSIGCGFTFFKGPPLLPLPEKSQHHICIGRNLH